MVWGVFVKNMVYQSQYPLEKYHTMFSALDNLVHLFSCESERFVVNEVFKVNTPVPLS